MQIEKKYRQHHYAPEAEEHHLKEGKMNAETGQPGDRNEEWNKRPRKQNHEKLKPHDSFKGFAIQNTMIHTIYFTLPLAKRTNAVAQSRGRSRFEKANNLFFKPGTTILFPHMSPS